MGRDPASKAALCWLDAICLTRVECLKLVQPDMKGLSLPPETQFLQDILCPLNSSQGYSFNQLSRNSCLIDFFSFL